MNIDKPLFKRLIDQSKASDLLSLQVNSLEKNSLQICQKEIESFIKRTQDYIVIVLRK